MGVNKEQKIGQKWNNNQRQQCLTIHDHSFDKYDIRPVGSFCLEYTVGLRVTVLLGKQQTEITFMIKKSKIIVLKGNINNEKYKKKKTQVSMDWKEALLSPNGDEYMSEWINEWMNQCLLWNLIICRSLLHWISDDATLWL